MYLKREVTAGPVIEVMKYHSSRYKNPCAGKIPNNRKTSKEQMRINEKNSIDGLRLRILANFKTEDIRLDLTYAGDEPDEKEATRRVNNFLTMLRRKYKKAGQELKWILTTELKGHRIHHHLLVNNIGWTRADYAACWPWAPLTYKAFRYYDGAPADAERVARYFVKETKTTYCQADRCQRARYRCSRNLKKPQIKKEIIHSKTWKEPKARKGYYIEKPIQYGYTAFGYPYMFYRMIKEGGNDGEVSHTKKSGRAAAYSGRTGKHDVCTEKQMLPRTRTNPLRRNEKRQADRPGLLVRNRTSVRRKARKIQTDKNGGNL